MVSSLKAAGSYQTSGEWFNEEIRDQHQPCEENGMCLLVEGCWGSHFLPVKSAVGWECQLFLRVKTSIHHHPSKKYQKIIKTDCGNARQLPTFILYFIFLETDVLSKVCRSQICFWFIPSPIIPTCIQCLSSLLAILIAITHHHQPGVSMPQLLQVPLRKFLCGRQAIGRDRDVTWVRPEFEEHEFWQPVRVKQIRCEQHKSEHGQVVAAITYFSCLGNSGANGERLVGMTWACLRHACSLAQCCLQGS